MGSFTKEWYLRKLAEQSFCSQPCPASKDGHAVAGLEGSLHEEIQRYCDSNFPPWKVIHARMDKKSTIPNGAQDFTIFMPQGQVLCVECKSGTGKLSPEQLIWSKELAMLGHTVHVVRSMEEFIKLVETKERTHE